MIECLRLAQVVQYRCEARPPIARDPMTLNPFFLDTVQGCCCRLGCNDRRFKYQVSHTCTKTPVKSQNRNLLRNFPDRCGRMGRKRLEACKVPGLGYFPNQAAGIAGKNRW